MEARCGLEDCDCEHTIEALVAALEAWERWFRQGEKAPLYRSGEAIAKAKR